MQELLVIGNPKRRRRTKKSHRRAAARRRRRPMTALQRQYFGGGRARANPSKRRRRGRSRIAAVARRSYRRARRAVGRYNFRSAISSPVATLKPALTGAIGATIVNTALARLPIPATFMTGRVRYLTQGAAAILLGMVASKAGAGAAVAAKMAEGSLTVTLHQAIQDIAAGMGMTLGGMGYYLPGYGATMPSASGNPARLSNMGMYMTGPGSGGSVVPMRRTPGMGNINTSFKF